MVAKPVLAQAHVLRENHHHVVPVAIAVALEQDIQAAAASKCSHDASTDSAGAGSTSAMATAVLVLLRRVPLLRVLHRTLAIVASVLLLLLLWVATIPLLGRISLLVITTLGLAAAVIIMGSAWAGARRVLLEVAGVGRGLVGRGRTGLERC